MIKGNVVQQFIKVNEGATVNVGGQFSGELVRKSKKNKIENDVSFHKTVKTKLIYKKDFF